MSNITATDSDQKICLVDPVTHKPVEWFRTKQAMRNGTGLSWKAIYDRIGLPLEEQKPITVREGQHRGEFLIAVEAGLKKLKPADPNATYVVLDGTKEVHRGTLGECSKHKLLNRALKIRLWQQS